MFSSDEKKILFILSYLKEATINWFEPSLMDPTNSTHWMWDFPAFINELEANFGPHNPVGDAEKALTELTMKDNWKIVKYNIEFWKLASKLNWNKSALCAHYFHRLPLHLHTEVLQSGGKPSTLSALYLKAQDTDEIYWMMKEETNTESKAPPKKDHKPSHSNSNSNSSSAPKSNNPLRSENSSKSDTKPKNFKEKSKDSTKLEKNRKLTTEEQDRRMKEGLCLYCREKGHVVQDCPKSKAAKACAATVTSNESKTDSTESKK